MFFAYINNHCGIVYFERAGGSMQETKHSLTKPKQEVHGRKNPGVKPSTRHKGLKLFHALILLKTLLTTNSREIDGPKGKSKSNSYD